MRHTLRRPSPQDPPQFLIVVVNLDKDRAGDEDYIAEVIQRAKAVGLPCVVCLVETKKGGENVRLIGVGVRVRGRRMVKVGDVGVHRDVEIAYIRLGRRRVSRRRRKVWLVAGHAPQRKSVASAKDPTGQGAQNTYFYALRDDVLDDLDTVAFIGDLNNKATSVANIVGGQPFGTDDDVLGGTVRGLAIVREWSTDIGKARGWTTHREAWVELTTKGEPT